MEKILKPFTIIPNHLYITRDADKQVESIISDMGRPGYVLVSRQMGKTNLLLHAKSKLEKEQDAFVYVDLSNVFDTAKECFENIIDTAIDSYSKKFDSIKDIIYKQRKEIDNIPAHKQHTSELRILLEALQGGKLVIILDEIDALTKTDYSDQIFSQIRSMYFSARVNYNGFNNLTYLLSGVVEPTEIIKDPKVSPFNIGQKIYLNDFSKEEFLNFLQIAKLNIDKESIDRIYYWTHGNPRITWDVCAEIENQIINKNCSVNLIDTTVNDLYFKGFNKAPVDNIREIVSNDKELRNSIVEIIYGNGKVISDKIKSKLYLSGIINYNDNDVVIKNEIIKQSLSLDWIRSLEREEAGIIKTSIEYFQRENYEEALIGFEKYLQDNNFDEDESSLYYYYLGLASYKTNRLEQASIYLDKSNFDKDDDSKSYYNVLNLKGTVYYYRNMLDESLTALKKVLEARKNDETYMTSLLNYGSFSLKSEETSHRIKAEEIFKSIINDEIPERIKHKEDFINEIRCIAHFNLGLIFYKNNNENIAIEHYQKAIELSKGNKPSIIMALIRLTKSHEEKILLIEKLIDLIVEGKLIPKETNLEKPFDFKFDEFRELVVFAFTSDKNRLYKRIVPFVTLLGNGTVSEHLFNIAINHLNQILKWNTTEGILIDIYSNKDNPIYNFNEEVEFNILKLLAYTVGRNEANNYHQRYLEIFKNMDIKNIDIFDMDLFVNNIYYLYDSKLYREAIDCIKLIKSKKNIIEEELLSNLLIVYHLELLTLNSLNRIEEAITTARTIITFSKENRLEGKKSISITEAELKNIIQNAQNFLQINLGNLSRIIPHKKYGSNQRIKVKYSDGRIVEIKFKKVEKDLIAGMCMIVE